MRASVVLRWLLYPLGTYAVLCLLLFLAQRRLLYFPTRVSEDQALALGRSEGLEPWRDGQGGLLGWIAHHPGGSPQALLLVLHGNAGMALHRAYLAAAFQRCSPGVALEVRILEYPGYGPRDGVPSEEALVEAVLRAVEHAGGLPLFVLGESIGSGVACRVAAARPGRVSGLVLITPMNGLRAVARHHYPWFPPLLVRDRFDSAAALRGFGGPVAFVLAGRDEVIPPELGRRLYEGYRGPKQLWEQPRATHNTLDYDPGRPPWTEVVAFLTGEASRKGAS